LATLVIIGWGSLILLVLSLIKRWKRLNIHNWILMWRIATFIRHNCGKRKNTVGHRCFKWTVKRNCFFYLYLVSVGRGKKRVAEQFWVEKRWSKFLTLYKICEQYLPSFRSSFAFSKNISTFSCSTSWSVASDCW